MDRNDESSAYALTAGHFIVTSEDEGVHARAEKPRAMAVKSVEIALKRGDRSRQFVKYQDHRNKLDIYDRLVGTLVFSEITTVEWDEIPFDHIDLGIIKVDPECMADNRLRKLADLSAFPFIEDADKIYWPKAQHLLGDEVFKIGIRTGRTFGTIIEPISVNWDTLLYSSGMRLIRVRKHI